MMSCMRVVALSFVGLATAALLVAGSAIYFGWYDVSATRPHTAAVNQLIETALTRSVSVRAKSIRVPNLDDPADIQDGFGLYRAHCVQCHGAPGVAPEPYALGLNPAPASLVESAHERSAGEVFWLIRQGIKMTGMPAWQYRLTDDQIWDVVAFMRVLPTLSPIDYGQWDERSTQPAPQTAPADAPRMGDAMAGRQALQQYMCVTCHVIPDVVGASSHIGPSLAGIATRPYIAGVLSNTPENMRRWLMAPTAIKPGTAMPDLRVSEQDARDITTFLNTLSAPD